MDHERLAQAVEEVDREARANAKEEEKENARLTKRNLRRQERLAPYHELKARNQAIFERASALATILPPFAESSAAAFRSVEYRVYVVIGAAKATPTTPNHTLVASVSTNQWDYNGSPCERVGLSFISVDQDTTSAIQKDPSSRGIVVESGYKSLTEEFSYTTGTSYDQIYDHASENTSGRVFSPILALLKVSDIRDISQRLADLEQSMGIIEGAAKNSELNPALANMLLTGSESERTAI